MLKPAERITGVGLEGSIDGTCAEPGSLEVFLHVAYTLTAR